MEPLSEKILDPVCGMSVDRDKTQFVSESQGKPYYFCAEACLKAFEKEPGKYLECAVPKRKGFWRRYLDRLNKSTDGKAMKCH
jgi:YHS domain-containing protein